MTMLFSSRRQFIWEVSSDTRFLIWAKELTDHVLTYFADKSTGIFSLHQRPDRCDPAEKEVYDGAMPSCKQHHGGKSAIPFCGFDKPDWLDLSVKTPEWNFEGNRRSIPSFFQLVYIDNESIIWI